MHQSLQSYKNEDMIVKYLYLFYDCLSYFFKGIMSLFEIKYLVKVCTKINTCIALKLKGQYSYLL